MLFQKIARFVKTISFVLLSMQSNFLQKRIQKRLGYKPKTVVKGCTVDLSAEEKNNLEEMNKEIKLILKRFKNNPEQMIDFISQNKTPVYRIKNIEKVLSFIGEEEGFISERTGLKSLYLNIFTKNEFKFKTEPMVLLNDGEVDIYNLIYYFHQWCAFKEGFPGFDEKSRKLLKKFNSKNKKNEDKLIANLSLTQIDGLKQAIARDVNAIDFVTQYSKESAGARKALEKLKSDKGASI